MLIPALGALFLLGAGAAPDPAYLGELTAAAHAQHLADEAQWLRLGHYRRGATGGWSSGVSGPPFFQSRDGSSNPSAELDATLAGFFAADPADAKAQHPQCQFPARLAWLASRLHLDPNRLPLKDCPRFEEFFGRLRARSVTFVFSSYYLNNPSSAFGHTFLRVNKTDAATAGKRWELLDYGVDYSATVDTDNAVAYAFKGLTGLFQGHFNYYPYFYKVREYNDSESRDLWEYDLNLTPDQVALLVAHLWELGSSWIDYYYLTDNCSFEVLTLLEAANPQLDLVSKVGTVVVPVDTIKALFAYPNLVREAHFRPSLRRQFDVRAERLSAAEADALQTVARTPSAPMPTGLDTNAAARVLDAAMDLVEFKDAKGILFGTDPDAMQREHLLEERRAALAVPSEDVAVPVPTDRPEQGHDSTRVGAAAGYSNTRGAFATYDFRLALHDLVDPPAGYPELSQIEFLPTRVRFFPDANRWWLEDFSFVQVISLNSVDRFNYLPSWNASFGATTVRDGGCDACLAGALRLGGGLAHRFGRGFLTAFAFLDAEAMASPDLHGPADIPVRLGVGPTAGLRTHFTADWLSLATAEGRWLWERHPRTTWQARWTHRVRLSQQVALNLEVLVLPGREVEGSAGIFAYL